MEPYSSFLSSYPTSLSSPPPLQLGVNKHHADHDHQFIHQPSRFMGLLPDMEAQATSSSTSNLVDAIGNLGGALKSGESKNSKDGSSEQLGEAKPTGRPKTATGKVRKPRYAFQTRSHVDILDDGYRWRKYGQKAVKNNKFPRSYYRCTFQGCNVKKQVQRLTKDEGIVVTTYEGMHSHPIEKSTDNFEHILSQFQIYTNI